MSIPRASAGCEVRIDGQLAAASRDQLLAGDVTVLDSVKVGEWGRSSLWEQPEASTATFRLRDQRVRQQVITDLIRAGKRVDVWATAPNPNVAPDLLGWRFEGMSQAGLDSISQMIKMPAELARTNLYPDPSMTSLDGKTAGGSATLAVSTAWASSGSSSVSITPTSSSNASSLYPAGTSGMSVFQAGKTYTVSATVRLAAAQSGTVNGLARRILIQAGTASATLANVAQSAAAPNAAGVTRLSVSFTVDPSWTVCRVQIVNGAAGTSNVMWVDSYMITEGNDLGPYFDGATSRTGYTYAWKGTTHASQSTETIAATDPESALIIRETGGNLGPFHVRVDTKGTRSRARIAMAQWGTRWDTGVRPMLTGEEWDYSIAVRLNGSTDQPATADLLVESWYSARRDDGPTNGVNWITIDGQSRRRITATDDEWHTYTGKIRNFSGRGYYPVIMIETGPSPRSLYPAIDDVVLTAPAQSVRRPLVWSGRISDVVISPAERSAIMIDVTCVAAIAEPEQIKVGAAPWPRQLVAARIDEIVAAVPTLVRRELTASTDKLPGVLVAERDVDKQPALDLIRDYASDVLGVVWHVPNPVMRGHVWIESLSARLRADWAGATGTISAYSLGADSFALRQSTDQLITMINIGWKESENGELVDKSGTLTNEAAADRYGVHTLDLQTELYLQASAENIGSRALEQASAQDWTVSGISFDTRRVDNTDGRAQKLLMILLAASTRPGTKITITELPGWVPGRVATGFVEGGSIEYVQDRWRFDLTMTAAAP